jgi:SAM-dependent methyltransferase
MQVEFLEVLRCPQCYGRLALTEARAAGTRVHSGWLVCADGRHRYPIRDFVPRFVPQSNYADSFGWQWQRFRRTQLDSYSGHPISAQRFWRATGWSPGELAGAWVLDAGCGAGRFAEIALRAGAQVVALDYSAAVDACYENLRQYPGLHVVQADIYALPFARRTFSRVYSLGVLQHTPDAGAAFAALPPMVRDGGRLAVDFYERSWKSRLLPKYWLRPLTTRVSQPRLFGALERWVPRVLRVSASVRRLPLLSRALRSLTPVADYTGVLPLSAQQQLEWSLLDTFDWYGPAYDHPQTARTLRTWSGEAGLREVEIVKAGHLVVRGVVTHASGN